MEFIAHLTPIAIAAILSATVPAAAEAQQAPQILERCGMAYGLIVGRTIPDLFRVRAVESADQTERYSIDNGGAFVTVDRHAQIREIQVAKDGLFTQRLIVIGDATLGDVLKRYGNPSDVSAKADALVLDYSHEGVAFRFAPISNPAALNDTMVLRSIVVHAKFASKDGRSPAACNVPSVDDETAAWSALFTYAEAYEARKASQVQDVFPGLKNAAVLDRAFQDLAEDHIRFRNVRLRLLSDNSAVAECVVEERVKGKAGGERQLRPRNQTFELTRTGNRWVILKITLSAGSS